MLGANLLIPDLEGLMKAIYDVDDYGLDQISTGNVVGFLMEAYEKGYIDSAFLDGLDLRWGDVPTTIQLIRKIAMRDGVGDLASKGVRKLACFNRQSSLLCYCQPGSLSFKWQQSKGPEQYGHE